MVTSLAKTIMTSLRGKTYTSPAISKELLQLYRNLLLLICPREHDDLISYPVPGQSHIEPIHFPFQHSFLCLLISIYINAQAMFI